MDAVNIATIVVALIAAAGAELSRRAAAKAARENTLVGGRVDMEKEAYDRARKFDTETIERQDAELDEIRMVHAQCIAKISEMETKHATEIRMLRARILRLEQNTIENIEEILNERLRESSPGDTAV